MTTHSFNHSNLSLRSYHDTGSTHSHHFYQIVLPLQGTLDLQIENKIGYVNPEQAAIILPEEKHLFFSHSHNLFLILDIALNNGYLNSNLPSFWNLSSDLKRYLHFSYHYLTQDNSNSKELLVKDFLLNLLVQEFSAGLDQKVLQAKNWIDRHLDQAISVQKLAKHCHLSTAQIQRRFKKVFGQNIGQYWRTIKLQHAKKLLALQNLSIEQIAYQVGYENLSAFSRSFLNYYGQTPSQWRNMLLSAQNLSPNDKTPTSNKC